MYKITRETNIVDRDEFEVGSYYKCVNPDSTGDGEVGEIYRLKKLSTGNMLGHFSHHSLETPATISFISLVTAQFELVQAVKPGEFVKGETYQCIGCYDRERQSIVGQQYVFCNLLEFSHCGHFIDGKFEYYFEFDKVELIHIKKEKLRKPYTLPLAENVAMITRDKCEREHASTKNPVSFLYNDRQREEAERIHKARNRWRF